MSCAGLHTYAGSRGCTPRDRAARAALRVLTSVAAITVVAVAAGPSTAAAQHWVDLVHVPPFVCHADFPLVDEGPLLAELAQLENDLVRYLAIAPSGERIDLYLFADRSRYREFLAQRYPQLPDRRALFVKGHGPGAVFVYRSRELAIDVRHESTHALLHAALPMVPLWLDEGLAEYFELPPQQRATGHTHQGSIRWQLRLGRVPRLERLEQLTDLSQMREAEYRDAWAWVHFMLHGPPEARDELIRFLADIRASTPPGLLSVRLERRLPQVHQRLAAHFKAWDR